MRRIRLFILGLAAFLAGLGLPGRAPAHGDIGSDKGGDLLQLAEYSNLVFIGRVVRVDYRVSDSRSGEGRLPHALVTYEVETVLRGEAPGKTFTMRFLGGPDGQGRFMTVSGVPQFQPGEQDLLFVTGNGERECPLVLCEWGRFRVLRSGVYNNHGFPVRAVDKNNAIARGLPPKEFLTFAYPAPAFDELIKNPQVQALMKRQNMSVDEMRKRYEAEAPKQIELSRGIPESPDKDADMETPGAAGDPKQTAIAMTPEGLPEGPIAIEQFTEIVKRIVSQAKRAPSPVRSIDPNAPIVVTTAKEQKPSRAQPGRVQKASPTREEAAELEALTKREFNPVLKTPVAPE